MMHVAGRLREPADTRSSIADYTVVDVNLRYAPVSAAWQLGLAVRNAFGADAREPSPFGTPFVPIPNDLPLPGRSLQLQATAKF